MGSPVLNGARPGRGGEGGCPKKQRACQSPEPGCCVLRPMQHQQALGFRTLEKQGTTVGAPAQGPPGPGDFRHTASPLVLQSSLLEMGLTCA